LRPLSYSKSHVILIAFALDTPDSLENVTTKVRTTSSLPCPPLTHTPTLAQWIEEVRDICGPTIPILLVGCKADLRPTSPTADPSTFVSRAQAERVAQQIGARVYKECSALKIQGVDDVFEAATRLSMLMREGVPTHGSSGGADGGDGGRHHRRRSSGKSGAGGEDDAGKGCCVVC
jgi:Rho family protein